VPSPATPPTATATAAATAEERDGRVSAYTGRPYYSLCWWLREKERLVQRLFVKKIRLEEV